ncbi:DUF4422 domain-containing protein [Allofournierella massiliensis]|uniref:DUF4422 domain-containing protein n=1 Tax=Allofournierella massiliensis TaxID=1650663 RepID=UPI0024B23BAF|nr:DUF4422 domain-containing protein [Fournierella massiliensis]
MEKNIKILISCHKPTDYVKNDIMQPIQVGSKNAKVRLEGMLHDDEGENLSERNPMYCEMTAQYWAWKNLDCDYYGFFHYRRYFAFNRPEGKYDSWGNLTESFFDENTVEKYGLSEENIRSIVEQADLILPEEKDIARMPNMGKNMIDQYMASGYLHRQDLDIMMDILREKYPEFVPYAERYLNGHTTYLNNMYIMKKEIFHEYCAWLFDILECHMQRANMADYSCEALRTPGHLAERLINIYCLYLKDKKNYRIKELPTVAFQDTDPLVKPKPAFQENNVAIALSANDYYAPYVSSLLYSMREYFTKENNYDILVMHRDISAQTQKNLKNVFAKNSNVSVRFFNVSRFGKQFEHLFLRGHFALETYFRLLMPELMPDYDKVLYLDCDVIVKADLAQLYATDVENCLLAACHDADTAGLYNGFEPHKKYYMDNILKIEHPYEYFQAGVILFNLAEFRKSYTSKQMLEFAASNEWELLDQDVLNYLAQNRYRSVDMAWNVMTNWRGIRIPEIVSRAPKYLRDEYMKAHSAPKIIHYAGPDKPWQQPDADYAEEFWRYARMSEYYEVMMQRLMRQSVQEGRPLPRKVRVKNKVKRVLQPIADKLLPKYTKRREAVKKLVKKVRR